MTMFNSPMSLVIHGKTIFVPSSPEKYLSGVYGSNWSIPNKDFSYDDYSK